MSTQNTSSYAGIIGGISALILLLIIVFTFRSNNTNVVDNGSESAAANVSAGETVFANGNGTLAVGDPAWEFEAVDVNGNSVALSDFAGQPIIINYWASWCGPCRVEFPHLQEAYEQYQDESVVLLAVN